MVSKDNPEEESKDIDVSVKVHAFAELQKRRRGEMRCKAIECEMRLQESRHLSGDFAYARTPAQQARLRTPSQFEI